MRTTQFVQQFFHRLGARCEQTAAGLRVELSREQRQLLEGRPRWSWSLPRDELTVLYLTFEESPVAQKNGQSGDLYEYAGPGSFRLRQIAEAAVRMWGLGRVFVRPRHIQVGKWRPHIVFHFILTYVEETATRQQKSVIVDLVSGAADEFSGFSADAELSSTDNTIEADTPRLSVGEAYERAFGFLCTRLDLLDDGWAREHRTWLKEEEAMLQSYVRRAELEEDPEPLAPVKAARLAELRHLLAPHVQVRAAAATVLYTLDESADPLD